MSTKQSFKCGLTTKCLSHNELERRINSSNCVLIVIRSRCTFPWGDSMGTPALKNVRYRFGPFELDPGSGVLSRNGNRVKLQDLPCRLLVMLVERPGSIVSREEVRQRLWPQNTFLEFDNSLGVAVRKVRDALGDDAETPRYVETVPRRGYRFLVPVERLDTQNPATPFVVVDRTS